MYNTDWSPTAHLRRARGHWRAAALLVLALALTAAALAAADVKLIDLDPYRGTGVLGDAYRAGFMAAMEGKKVGADDIVLIPRNADESLTDIDAILKRVLRDHPDVLALTGAIGREPVDAITNSAIATDNHIVSLGSASFVVLAGDFNTNHIFYNLNAPTKVAALMRLATEHLRVRSHAIFYSADVDGLNGLINRFQRALTSAGQPLRAVYDHVSGDSFSAEKTEAIIATRPQVIYVYAKEDDVLTQFLRTVWMDSRTAKTKILTVASMQSYYQQVIPLLKWQYGINLEPAQVVLVSSIASSADTHLLHVQQFHQEMKAYISAGSSALFTDATILESDTSVATQMLVGWVSGTATLAMLRTTPGLHDRATFQRGLFSQRRVRAADDLLYGTYSDTCLGAGEAVGWSCECNIGGRTVYFRELDGNGVLTATSAAREISFDADTCTLTESNTRFSFGNGVVFNFTDASMVPFQYITDSFAHFLTEKKDGEARTVVLQTTVATMQADYDAYVATHTVDFIIGIIADPAFDPRGAVIIDPTPRHPQIASSRSERIYISPTTDQQLYLLYTFLSSDSDDVIYPVDDKSVTVTLKDIVPSETQQYSRIFKMSAATFDMDDPTMHSVDESTAVVDSLAPKGYNFVIGMSLDDIASIVDFLDHEPQAAVVLLYNDFATYYMELMRRLGEKPVSVQARLLSMTNFPLWSDTSKEAEADSQLLASFHALFPAEDANPRAMSMYIVGTLLHTLLDAVSDGAINSTTLLTHLYRDTYWYAKDLRLGPFKTCNETYKYVAGTGSDCESRNFGGFEVSILSAQRVLDPTQPPNMPFTQPALIYRNRPKRLSKGAIAGIIVGCVAAAAIVMAIIIGCWCCFTKDARDNKNAPKDPSEPVTIMFTDIESSTALWARVPAVMSEAVAKHHSVIRGAIASYKGYEVKTIGDSFMIACKDATTATQLAVAIQVALLAVDYGTDEIDTAYREREMEREADDEDQLYKAHSARLPSDTYASMWGGLRVRIGMHTGICDVRYDEVSKGYDYYGETVNMAARTEAIGNGGQVVVTGTTWDALSEGAKSALHHHALGPVALRGVPHPVPMVQVDAVAGRQFPALRTEIEIETPDECTDVNSSAQATVASMSAASILISNVLTTLFAPFMPSQRTKEVKSFLSRWGITVPSKPQSVSANDYNTFLTNRLAVKVSAVYQKTQRQTAGTSELGSVFGRLGTTHSIVNDGLTQLPSHHSLAYASEARESLSHSSPAFTTDVVQGVSNASHRQTRSFAHRIAKRLSGKHSSGHSTRHSGLPVVLNVGQPEHGAAVTVGSQSSFSAGCEQPVRAPVRKRVYGCSHDDNSILYEVPGGMDARHVSCAPQHDITVAVVGSDTSVAGAASLSVEP